MTKQKSIPDDGIYDDDGFYDDSIDDEFDAPISSSNLGNNLVTQHSTLARAAQRLSLQEKRVIMAAISKVDSRHEIKLAREGVKIHADEIAETFGIPLNDAYDVLQTACKQMFERSWTTRGFDPMTKKPTKIVRRWVTEAEYAEGSAWCRVQFHEKTLPFIMGLSKNFTSYRLSQASALRSIYSWRMLENIQACEMKAGKGIWNVRINHFHDAMGVPDSVKKNFSLLNKRVIQPAVKELAADWKIEVLRKHRGRRVIGLIIEFERNDQGDLFSES